MTKSRLEAFSDGVLAIIITIMVLELKAPPEPSFDALRPMLPLFISYALSFTFIGIYWANHHHMFQLVKKVNGRILWLNLHLLFWLSLVPFGTAWMAQSRFATVPVFIYGVFLLCAGLAYNMLSHALSRLHGAESTLAKAVGTDIKGRISAGLYGLALFLVWINQWLAYGVYVAVALMWLVPDRRIENLVEEIED